MKRFLKSIFTIFLPLWTFIGSKTSYLWMIASAFGIILFNTPDTGDNIKWALTDGMPTSKFMTTLLMPLNMYLYRISDYLENKLYLYFPRFYKPLSIIGSYLSLQIVFLRCFLVMLMRFTLPMVIVLALSYVRAKSKSEREECRARSTWLPPIDKKHEQRIRPYKKILRKETIEYGSLDAEYFNEKNRKELEKQRSVKKYPVYTDNSETAKEDPTFAATAPNYYDWYNKSTPDEPVNTSVSVKKKRINPYKESERVGMFQN